MNDADCNLKVRFLFHQATHHSEKTDTESE